MISRSSISRQLYGRNRPMNEEEGEGAMDSPAEEKAEGERGMIREPMGACETDCRAKGTMGDGPTEFFAKGTT